MKRILYIATSDIYKKTGGGIANLALLNSLSKQYSDRIDVLHYQECLKSPFPPNFIPVPTLSTINKLKSIMYGRIHRFYPWLDEFLSKYAYRYSHCIVNTGILGDYITKFHSYGIKVTVIHHNYEVEFQLDNKRPSTFYGLTDYFVRKCERKSYLESDMNLFLSADDMDTFHRQYSDDNSAPESIIGIFEPYDSIINVLPLTPLPPNKLAICGSLNSIQTIKGIEHFRNNCLTALAKIYKDNYILRIAGRNPGKIIYDLFKNNNNIKIIPNPVEMSNVIKDCGIFICPTNVGGGIKLRILDGLKLGMPILTHEVSARGYNALHQYNWFQMYHDEESFAKGLSHIIKTIDTNIHLRKEILEVYNNLFSATHGDTKFLKAMKVFLDS